MTRNGINAYFESVEPGDDAMLRQWHSLYVKSFPDENDREPWEQLAQRRDNPSYNRFNILCDKTTDEVIGMELINYNPAIPGALYVPYAAISPKHRSHGIGTKMAEVSDRQMRQESAQFILYDLESPKEIHRAFDQDYGGPATKQAATRLKYWGRIGTLVIDDPDLPYLRPASDDGKKTQDYDLMAVRALGNDRSLLPVQFNEDGTAIDKASYRHLYLIMMRLQYGNISEQQLVAEYPAIAQFLKNVDSSPKQWVNLAADKYELKQSARATLNIESRAGRDMSYQGSCL